MCPPARNSGLTELDEILSRIDKAYFLANVVNWQVNDPKEETDLSLVWGSVSTGLYDHLGLAYEAALKIQEALVGKEVGS
ncbi:MAG: hypothetical protein HQL52_19760 [Magnetococcales bacterium]|nr:hypothetical protein [Magnetococcales bacterium]